MEYSTEPADAASSDRTLDGNELVPGRSEIGPGRPAFGRVDRPGTGELRVDAALELLDQLPGLPVTDHPELFEQVHERLTEVLGELAWGPGGPADPQGG